MAKWDVFHVREFQQAFGVEEEEVRRMLREGKLRGDDCLRISGDEQWIRISAIPKFHQDLKQASKPAATSQQPPAQPPIHRVRLQRPAEKPQPPNPPIQEPEPPSTRKVVRPPQPAASERPAPPPAAPAASRRVKEQEEELRAADVEPDDDERKTIAQEPAPKVPAQENPSTARWATEPAANLEDDEDGGEQDDGGFFALARRRSEVEELDLTAMVDVTFLLVLFFMLTATYTLQESIDVPPPDPEQKKAQQAIQSLDDLREDYIVVTINADNSLEVDGERVGADFSTLVNRIRRINRESSRNELVIYADPAAYHETVVLVYDAANEVGMQRIRLAAEAGGG